jgi:hypothetical protein
LAYLRRVKKMKKIALMVLVFGFAIFALTAMFVLAGCGDNGDPSSPPGGENPFVGTWSWTGSGTVVSGNYTFGITTLTIVFTDDTYDLSETIITVNGNSNSMNMKTRGKYTYDGNTASVIQEQHSGDGGTTWTNEIQPAMEYTVNKNVLSFPSNVTTITLTKQNGYDGQIFHCSIDTVKNTFVEGEPVTTISTGTINDRRQNNVNNEDPNVYFNVGSISNNKVTLSLPAAVDNSKLDNEKGPYVGIFGHWGIVGTSQRIDLMCFTGDDKGDALVIYSAAAKEDLEYDGDTLAVNAGWNFFITPFDSGARYKVSGLDDLYQKGFKWYLRPSN